MRRLLTIARQDYHVIHHDAPHVHWSEIPAKFEADRNEYVGASLFKDTEEGVMLGWLLTKNWDALAEKYVDLTGKMTHEQKRDLLIARARARV